MSKAEACQRTFTQLLETCAISIPVKGITKAPKGKRAMSGYNCFTKNLYAAEKRLAKKQNRDPMSYSKLLKMKTWKTLQEKQKNTWNGLAKQGCPDIPDPKNVGD